MQFHVTTLTSVVEGHLISPNLIKDMAEILGYMTGCDPDDMSTIGLYFAAMECQPALIQQFPWLEEVDLPDNMNPNTLELICLGLVAKYGEMHEVKTLKELLSEVLVGEIVEEGK